MSKRFYHGAALAGIIGLCIIGILLVVDTNPLSTTKGTTGTMYNVDTGTTSAPPTWGTNWWNQNNTAIPLTYSASEDLWVRVQWNLQGVTSGTYTLWYSIDNGASWTQYTNIHTSLNTEIIWQITADWSTWTDLKLMSSTDITSPAVLPQRPSLAGE